MCQSRLTRAARHDTQSADGTMSTASVTLLALAFSPTGYVLIGMVCVAAVFVVVEYMHTSMVRTKARVVRVIDVPAHHMDVTSADATFPHGLLMDVVTVPNSWIVTLDVDGRCCDIPVSKGARRAITVGDTLDVEYCRGRVTGHRYIYNVYHD